MSFAELLKEHYEVVYLSEAECIKYYLIDRYEKRVSKRLLLEKVALRQKGKELLKKEFKKLVFTDSPFLRLLPEGQSGFAGKYVPVPLNTEG